MGTFALPRHQPSKSDASHLLMLGDWGRETKDQAQHLVAQGMIGYTKKHDLSLQALLMLGDNWYDALPGGVHSARWQTGFEDMYPKAMFDCPAYAIPGNHDYQVMPESKLQQSLSTRVAAILVG